MIKLPSTVRCTLVGGCYDGLILLLPKPAPESITFDIPCFPEGGGVGEHETKNIAYRMQHPPEPNDAATDITYEPIPWGELMDYWADRMTMGGN